MTAFDRHPVRNTLLLVAGAIAVLAIIGAVAGGARTVAPSQPPASRVSVARSALPSALSPSPSRPAHSSRPAATRAARVAPSVTPVATQPESPSPAPATTTTTAPAQVTAPPPATTAPPAAAAPACTPLTDSGNCYEPGEFCRTSDHGMTGVAGDGETITCEDNDGWRWEPS